MYQMFLAMDDFVVVEMVTNLSKLQRNGSPQTSGLTRFLSRNLVSTVLTFLQQFQLYFGTIGYWFDDLELSMFWKSLTQNKIVVLNILNCSMNIDIT